MHLVTTESQAVCPAVACPIQGETPDGAYCSSFNRLSYGPDPNGFGSRFTATLNLQGNGELVGDNRFEGVIRWSTDGAPLGESEVVQIGTNEYASILVLPDPQLSSNASIFAEFIGEEQYPAFAVGNNSTPLDIEFEGSACFSWLTPFKSYPAWTTGISLSTPEIEFGDTIDVITEWTLDPQILNPNPELAGRFILRRGGIPIAAAPIEGQNDAQNLFRGYRPRIPVAALGLGEHTFDAGYIGNEGALAVQSPATLTVKHPKRPLLLRLRPGNFIAKAGAATGPQICALTRSGNLPFEIESAMVDVRLLDQSEVEVSTFALILDAQGCAAFSIDTLAPGRYNLETSFTGNARYQQARGGGAFTITPSAAPAMITPVFPPVSGTEAVEVRLVAPPDSEPLAPVTDYERLPRGVELQAQIRSASGNSDLPNGSVELLINDQPVAPTILGRDGRDFVTLGPLDLAPGDYSAVLAYSGNDTYAAHYSDPIIFSVDTLGRPTFMAHPQLRRQAALVADDYDLNLDIGVVTSLHGLPAVLAVSLEPKDGATPARGIPGGLLTFFGDGNELGSIRLHGYGGAIRLPNGLPEGLVDLKAEYLQ